MPTAIVERHDLLNATTVITYMHAKPGKESELRDAPAGAINPTTKERGYAIYDLYQDVDDPSVFFYENWKSAETLMRAGTLRTCSTSRPSWATCSTTVA